MRKKIRAKNKRENPKIAYPIAANCGVFGDFQDGFSGHSSLVVASNGVLDPTRNKLICFDLDSTLIDCETLDILAEEMGVGKEVKKITALAMNGEIDFETAVKERLKFLKGFPVKKINALMERVPLMPGAKELIFSLKKEGFVISIITGSYDVIAYPFAKQLGVDFCFANTLGVKDRKLTGKFNLKVNGNKDKLLNKLKKDNFIDFVVAVGDGTNDLPMLKVADLGIAFCAKPNVNRGIALQINEKNLLKVLEIMERKTTFKN